jgi:F-type H+-transporting ATPase subunit a
MTTVLAAEGGVPELGHLFDFATGLWNLPFLSWTIYSMLIGFTLVSVFMLTAFNKQQIVPGKYQLIGESVVNFVRQNIAEEVIGHEGHKYVAYLTTLFLLIFSWNFMEILPGVSFPATSKIAVPIFFALVTWVVYNFEGIRNIGFGTYMKGVLFPPGVPLVMYLLLTPIEFLSIIIIRPITLTLRLTFNMVAGHLILSLLAILASSLWVAGPKALGLPFVVAMGAALSGFELFVAFLQAFIFTILTALYIGGAVHPEH